MSTELEEVPMRIVVALDVHRRQITYKTLNRESGEVWRGRIAPATRGAVREWLEQFAGCEAEFALEGDDRLAFRGRGDRAGRPPGASRRSGRDGGQAGTEAAGEDRQR